MEKRHFFDDPSRVRLVIRGLFAACALLLAADFFFHRHLSFREGTFAPEGWWGFYGIYGFVACVLLVLGATQLRRILMRDEDYYDR